LQNGLSSLTIYTLSNINKVWSDWCSGEGVLETLGIADDVGHFVAEEAPEPTAMAITKFYQLHDA